MEKSTVFNSKSQHGNGYTLVIMHNQHNNKQAFLRFGVNLSICWYVQLISFLALINFWLYDLDIVSDFTCWSWYALPITDRETQVSKSSWRLDLVLPVRVHTIAVWALKKHAQVGKHLPNRLYVYPTIDEDFPYSHIVNPCLSLTSFLIYWKLLLVKRKNPSMLASVSLQEIPLYCSVNHLSYCVRLLYDLHFV